MLVRRSDWFEPLHYFSPSASGKRVHLACRASSKHHKCENVQMPTYAHTGLELVGVCWQLHKYLHSYLGSAWMSTAVHM